MRLTKIFKLSIICLQAPFIRQTFTYSEFVNDINRYKPFNLV